MFIFLHVGVVVTFSKTKSFSHSADLQWPDTELSPVRLSGARAGEKAREHTGLNANSLPVPSA